MNEKLYIAIKSVLNNNVITDSIYKKQLIIELKKYELINSDDYKRFKSIVIDFGANVHLNRKSGVNIELTIKRAILFNYLNNYSKIKLSFESIANIINVDRTACYYYLKKYDSYNRFYPITKELQQEFNQILEKYEKE